MQTPDSIVKLCDGIAQTIKEMWPLYVDQTYTTSMIEIWTGGFLLLLAVAAFCLCLHGMKRSIADNCTSSDWTPVAVISGMAAVALLTIGIVVLIGGIKGINNPEYYTQKWLIRQLTVWTGH